MLMPCMSYIQRLDILTQSGISHSGMTLCDKRSFNNPTFVIYGMQMGDVDVEDMRNDSQPEGYIRSANNIETMISSGIGSANLGLCSGYASQVNAPELQHVP